MSRNLPSLRSKMEQIEAKLTKMPSHTCRRKSGHYPLPGCLASQHLVDSPRPAKQTHHVGGPVRVHRSVAATPGSSFCQRALEICDWRYSRRMAHQHPVSRTHGPLEFPRVGSVLYISDTSTHRAEQRYLSYGYCVASRADGKPPAGRPASQPPGAFPPGRVTNKAEKIGGFHSALSAENGLRTAAAARNCRMLAPLWRPDGCSEAEERGLFFDLQSRLLPLETKPVGPGRVHTSSASDLFI